MALSLPVVPVSWLVTEQLIRKHGSSTRSKAAIRDLHGWCWGLGAPRHRTWTLFSAGPWDHVLRHVIRLTLRPRIACPADARARRFGQGLALLSGRRP